jgi:hypothetical protein
MLSTVPACFHCIFRSVQVARQRCWPVFNACRGQGELISLPNFHNRPSFHAAARVASGFFKESMATPFWQKRRN